MLEVDNNRLEIVKKDFDDSHDLKTFCQEKGLLDLAQPTNKRDEFFIPCFMHEDNHPSLGIDFVHNRFNCFSCGKVRGSSVSSFVYFYEKLVGGYTKGFASFLNDYLKSSPVVSSRVGFNTVFRTAKKSSFDLNQSMLRRSVSLSRQDLGSMVITEIPRRLRKRMELTLDVKMSIIRLMQQGFTPEQIYHSIISNSSYMGQQNVIDNSVKQSFDFSAIIKDRGEE